MNLPYRKIVCDAALPILAGGFNAQINSLAVEYDIAPFSIDFSRSSASFAFSRIGYANIEECRLTDFNPIAGCMYTGAASNTKTIAGYRFTGPVELCIRWWIRSRAGVEGFDTESLLNATEDATTTLFEDPGIQWPAGVILARGCEGTRDEVTPLGDGWGQCATISIPFEVYIQ